MREVGSVSLTDYMVELKDKKKHLVDQFEKLLLEYAETCEALRSEYQQKGCETRARDESGYAARARLKASNLPQQLLGINIR